VCNRVLILDRGRVVAEGRPDDLSQPHLSVIARGDREALVKAVQAIDGVSSVESTADGDTIRLTIHATKDVREAVAAAITALGSLRELRPAVAALSDLFARLTEKS
jgi:ABC-type uncharacterized transport system ATPase subunit